MVKYPSRATNTGTDQRSGVHLLQAIINKINGTCEIADTQAAAVCLGLRCVETSCHTTYVFIHAAVAVVTERLDTDAGHDDPEKAWDEDHHPQSLICSSVCCSAWILSQFFQCIQNHRQSAF